MLFSGRHLAQCVIVWSHCLTVMVSEVCLKLGKRYGNRGGSGKLRRTTTHLLKQNNLYYFLLYLTSFPVGSKALQQWVKGQSKQRIYKWHCWGDLTHNHPKDLQTRSDVKERQKQTQFPPEHSVLSPRWDPTCFQITFSLSSSALWPEGSHYTQLASRRFLLLNAWLMCLTNSSSQAARHH